MTRAPLSLLAALAVGAAGCTPAGAEPDVAPMPDLTPPVEAGARVEVARLGPAGVQLTLDLPGEVAGHKDVLLSAALGGLVEDVKVETGDVVSKGQVLFTVDRAPYAAQVAQAEAQLQLATAELGRVTKMGDLGVPAELDARTAQVAIAEAGLRLARSQLDRAVVRSPIDGVIAGISVDAGEVVAPGSPVARVVQLDPIKVSLSVSDRDVVALRPGMDARVATPARGLVRMGTVSNIGQAADLSTRSFLVEIELPNPDHLLLPGMIAKVEVDRPVADGAIVIPQDWLVTKVDGYGVFVAEGETARWRTVTLGDVVRGQVVVASGLQLDERVVMTGQHELVDGDKLLIAREGACCADGRATF
jgi:RND family efflux transporter MFP subunit